MVKRKIEGTKFNPKKTYSECDSDEGPEWLPPDSSSSSESDSSSETESQKS